MNYINKKLIVTAITAVMAQNSLAQELPEVQINATLEANINQNVINKQAINKSVSSTSDVVNLLKTDPTISVNQAGAVSGFPVIRGISDHRLNVEVDGMPLLASCPNHMNTPLSYISPAQAESIAIYPSITPVSLGGDSIGGTIAVDTKAPWFAPTNEFVTKGEMGAFYRDNGDAMGADVLVSGANDKLNITYKGSKSKANNYDAADDFKDFTTTANAGALLTQKRTEFTEYVNPGDETKKDEVAGTAYESVNHNLSLAYKGDDKLLQANLTVQNMPYEQYPNQRMDMTGNQSTKLNLAYEQALSWGDIKLQAYKEDVDHVMAFLDYKTSTQMPMDTESTTQGFKASAMIPLDDKSELNMGAELQHYKLEDWWDSSCPSMGMCTPDYDEFLNINNGTRDRNALYAEWISDINTQWKTRIGARYELVNMNADEVHGYGDRDQVNPMKITNEATDAAAFNAADRSVTDNNLNLTALATYQHSETFDVDMGIARQVRSPTLYERYTWSTWAMAAIMNNFVGDGNGYYGDINLKPETAYTLSTTFDWHAANNKDWSIQVMPYVSHIENYIDAEKKTDLGDFNVYQYVNETARIYGIDVAAQSHLAKGEFGNLRGTAKVNYARGINLETNDNLYNIMPLNATLGLIQSVDNWSNSVELVLVKDKTEVSENRNEIQTAGYSLINWKTSYTLKQLRLDFGIDNVFDRAYDLPTGGAYSGEGNTMSITGIPLIAVPGAGRTIYAGVNYKF